MSVWSTLFSAPKTIDKLTDGIYNGLDMAVYTEEEKKQMDLKVLDFRLEYMKATAHQSLSRRIIACMVVGLWVLLILTAAIFDSFGVTTKADAIFELLKDVVNRPFEIVLGFYFLAHVAGKFKK